MTKYLKKRKDFINALMLYHREYYTDGGFPSIFSLQIEMIDKGICPRCGKPTDHWSSDGKFPCFKCGFKLTGLEADKIIDDINNLSDKAKKSILRKRLMQK